MDIELNRLATILVMGLVFMPLELFWPATKAPGFDWGRYRTDVMHVLVGGTIIRIGTAAALTWSVGLVGFHSIGPSWPIWVQILSVLLISDFMFYFAHRLYHAVPLLWEFHKIHHSSEHLDWLASYRVHPVDQVINATVIALPALVLGFSPLALIAYAAVYQWHAILLHSNIRLSFGLLGRIVVLPRFHRWHHANEPQAYDCNFGGQLSIWDRLLGTYYEPDREPIAFGLENAPRESFLAHVVEPFRRLDG